jgi:hypothetical protein
VPYFGQEAKVYLDHLDDASGAADPDWDRFLGVPDTAGNSLRIVPRKGASTTDGVWPQAAATVGILSQLQVRLTTTTTVPIAMVITVVRQLFNGEACPDSEI